VTPLSLDESCGLVDGLQEIAGVFNTTCGTHSISMEDCVSLAALAAIKFMNGPFQPLYDRWKCGRKDIDEMPQRILPNDGSRHSIDFVLAHVGGLDIPQSVAIMACHGTGAAHVNVTGVDAERGRTPFALDNSYFKFLLEQEKNWRPFAIERNPENASVAVLPSDMSICYAIPAGKKKKRMFIINTPELELMLQRAEWRVWVEKFAKDKKAWEHYFVEGFDRILNANCKGAVRPYLRKELREAKKATGGS
jgi:catalase (peroxidase I)